VAAGLLGGGREVLARVTAVALRTTRLLREAGRFAQEPSPSGRSRASA
jgi:hypothetical protein